MLKFNNLTSTIFISSLTVLLGIFLWAGISGTRLLGDGKDTFSPEDQKASRSRSSSGTYHRFYHK